MNTVFVFQILLIFGAIAAYVLGVMFVLRWQAHRYWIQTGRVNLQIEHEHLLWQRKQKEDEDRDEWRKNRQGPAGPQ